MDTYFASVTAANGHEVLGDGAPHFASAIAARAHQMRLVGRQRNHVDGAAVRLRVGGIDVGGGGLTRVDVPLDEVAAARARQYFIVV